MSFDKKPEILEEVDDELFQQLPANYRLMEPGSGLPMQVAYCESYGATIGLDPFHRPITKILTHPRTKEPK